MRIFGQIVIVLLIIAIVISLEIITSKITKNCIDTMEYNVDNLSKLIDEDISEANKNCEKVVEEWNILEKRLNYYLEHNEVEKVTKQVVILKSQLELKDTNYAKQNIAELKFLLEHIEGKPKIKINNIF